MNPEDIRILVVDDEGPILELLGEYLSTRGHPVVTASTGEQARTLLVQEEFQVVLTDIKMPGMDGLMLLEHIQESRPGTAVILMTGYGTIESAIRAMKNGALDYLQKPFKLRDVYATIESAMARSEKQLAAAGAQTLPPLQQAASAIEAPEHLPGLYEALCNHLSNSLGDCAVMAAFREPERDHWVPYSCTSPSSFRGFDLQAAGSIVREGSVSPTELDYWIGTPAPSSTLLEELPIRVDVSGPNRPCGFLAVASTVELEESSTDLLQLSAAVAGDAITRQFLTARLMAAQGTPQTLLPLHKPDVPRAERVQQTGTLIGEALELGEPDLQAIRWAGRLQDKMPTLSESAHGTGMDIMTMGGGGLPISVMGILEPVLLALYERFDGTGSPKGLSGDSIPMASRVVALASWWDHHTVARRFAPRLARSQALEALSRESGVTFDPTVVDALRQVLKGA